MSEQYTPEQYVSHTWGSNEEIEAEKLNNLEAGVTQLGEKNLIIESEINNITSSLEELDERIATLENASEEDPLHLEVYQAREIDPNYTYNSLSEAIQAHSMLAREQLNLQAEDLLLSGWVSGNIDPVTGQINSEDSNAIYLQRISNDIVQVTGLDRYVIRAFGYSTGSQGYIGVWDGKQFVKNNQVDWKRTISLSGLRINGADYINIAVIPAEEETIDPSNANIYGFYIKNNIIQQLNSDIGNLEIRTDTVENDIKKLKNNIPSLESELRNEIYNLTEEDKKINDRVKAFDGAVGDLVQSLHNNEITSIDLELEMYSLHLLDGEVYSIASEVTNLLNEKIKRNTNDISSIQEVIEDYNLFNKNNIDVLSAYIDYNEPHTLTLSTKVKTIVIPILPSHTYYITCNKPSTKRIGLSEGYPYINTAVDNYSGAKSNDEMVWDNFIITAGANHNYLCMQLYRTDGPDTDLNNFYNYLIITRDDLREKTAIDTKARDIVENNEVANKIKKIDDLRKMTLDIMDGKQIYYSSQNLFVNVDFPNTEKKELLPRLCGQTLPTYEYNHVCTLTESEHGFKATCSTGNKDAIRIQFGPTNENSEDAHMQGLTAGQQYTISFDYTAKLGEDGSAQLRWRLYDNYEKATGWAASRNILVCDCSEGENRTVTGHFKYSFTVRQNITRLYMYFLTLFENSSLDYPQVGDYVEIKNLAFVEGSSEGEKIPEVSELREIVNDMQLMKPIDMTSISMFNRIGFCGDSYTRGSIGGVETYSVGTSFPAVLSKMTGVETRIYAHGGATAGTWLTTWGADCIEKLELEAQTNPCDLYIIMLGINDAAQGVDIGSSSDWNNPSSASFYANMKKIYDRINIAAPESKIIFVKPPKLGNLTNIYAAIEDIAIKLKTPWFSCLDDQFYNSDFYQNNIFNSHPLAIIYSGMAKAMKRQIEGTIYNYSNYFENYVDGTYLDKIALSIRKNTVAKNIINYPIGKIITIPWKNMDDSNHNTDETAYQVEWVVVHHEYVTIKNKNDEEKSVPGMFLQMKKAIPYGVQFSAAQAFYYCAETLTAGTYYFTLDVAYDTIAANSILEFTLTQPVPAGGRIRMATDRTVTTWSANGNTTIETTTAEVVSSSAGVNLGTTSAGGLNSVNRMRYGSNRWKTSAVRQYLNKTGTGWFTSQEDFDIRPNQYGKQGFKTGFNTDFLNAIKPVKVTTALNTVEGFTSATEDTYDTFFLPSLQQMNITPQLEDAEGNVFEYWRDCLGTNNYVNIGSSNVYDAFKIPTINSDSAQHVRLRSAYHNSDYITWYVNSSGYAITSGANNTIYFTPVCVIC